MKGHRPERLYRLPAFDGPVEAYRLSADGAGVLFASYPAGTVLPFHRHDTDNYGVMSRGESILTIGDTVDKDGPGDWYRIPVGVEHAASFEQETEETEFWFDVATGTRQRT